MYQTRPEVVEEVHCHSFPLSNSRGVVFPFLLLPKTTHFKHLPALAIRFVWFFFIFLMLLYCLRPTSNFLILYCDFVSTKIVDILLYNLNYHLFEKIYLYLLYMLKNIFRHKEMSYCISSVAAINLLRFLIRQLLYF